MVGFTRLGPTSISELAANFRRSRLLDLRLKVQHSSTVYASLPARMQLEALQESLHITFFLSYQYHREIGKGENIVFGLRSTVALVVEQRLQKTLAAIQAVTVIMVKGHYDSCRIIVHELRLLLVSYSSGVTVRDRRMLATVGTKLRI